MALSLALDLSESFHFSKVVLEFQGCLTCETLAEYQSVLVGVLNVPICGILGVPEMEGGVGSPVTCSGTRSCSSWSNLTCIVDSGDEDVCDSRKTASSLGIRASKSSSSRSSASKNSVSSGPEGSRGLQRALFDVVGLPHSR